MKAVNAKGETVELIDGQWRKVASAPAPEVSTKPATAKQLNGVFDALMVGAGDTFNSVGLNARDVWAGVTGNTAEQGKIEAERQDAAMYREQMTQESPWLTGLGRALPALATAPLSGGAGLAGMAGNVGMGAIVSGATSASGDIGGDAASGALWGAGGQLASNIVQRVSAARDVARMARAAPAGGGGAAGAAAGGLDDAQREIVQGARNAGMQVLPGQASGDRTLRQFEAGMASNPFAGRVLQQIEGENVKRLNTLAAAAMGEKADNVGAAVRAAAEHRIGTAMQDVGDALGTVNTSGLHKALKQIAADEEVGGLPTNAAWKILKRFEKGAEARGRAVAGQGEDLMAGGQLMKMRSEASKQMRDAFASNRSDIGDVMGQAVNAIDDAIYKAARSGGDEALVDAYSTAREQWSVLRALDKGGGSIDGQVLPGQMARLIGQSDKTGFVGRADDVGKTLQRTTGAGNDPLGTFYDALRFRASSIGKPIVGDSGTATRLVGGGGLGEMVVNTGKGLLKGAVVNPAMKAYAGMSPEAAAAAGRHLAAQQAMEANARGNALGGALARGLAGGL